MTIILLNQFIFLIDRFDERYAGVVTQKNKSFCNIVTTSLIASSNARKNRLTDIKVYIHEVLQGNMQAFEKIVEQYQSMVFSICFNVLKQRVLAEEAAQDVFVKVFKKLNSFEERSSFKTWIYRIAFRTAIDHQRKRKMLTTSIDQEDRPLQLSDGSKSSQEVMEHRDRMTTLEDAIKKLDAEDAVLISLYYYEDKNVKEVADTLSLTESNVKIKLFRARKKLKVLLENKIT